MWKCVYVCKCVCVCMSVRDTFYMMDVFQKAAIKR